MTELAYDIARGANFKFNTMFMGNTVRFLTTLLVHFFVVRGKLGKFSHNTSYGSRTRKRNVCSNERLSIISLSNIKLYDDG